MAAAALAEAWARLGAALGAGDDRDPPEVAVLWLLLEHPELAAGEEAAGALLALLALPEPPGPPRALLLLATVTVLLAAGPPGHRSAAAATAFAALLRRPGEPRPGAAAECLRELRDADAVAATSPSPSPAAAAALLDAAFLQPPAAQARALWALSRAAPAAPAALKAPLGRLLGGAGGAAAPLHGALRLKAALGEALFTAEDEAFLLRRLAALAQHPALPPPRRLFFLHCVAAFPENRPLGAGGPPVLLTPRLAAGLFPARCEAPPGALPPRFALAAAVCAEDGGPEARRGARCLRRLALELAAAGPPAATLFCRAAAVYAARLGPDAALAAAAAGLYARCPALAPALLDLAAAAGPGWAAALGAALRRAALAAAAAEGDELRWHLRVLARAPGAAGGGAAAAARRLRRLAVAAAGDWRGGHAALAAAARLLPAPPPPLPAADVDVRDRARLYGKLAAAVGADKLAAITRPGDGTAAARPRAFSAPAARRRPTEPPPALCLHRLPQPPPPPLQPAPADEPTDSPAAYGRAAARRRAAPALRLRLRLEPGPQRLLALQLRLRPPGGPAAETRLPALGPRGAEVAVALRPRGAGRPVAAAAAFTAPGGRVATVRLPPLPLTPAELLRPLALPAGWGPGRRRRAFGAMWAALGAAGGAETVLPRAAAVVEGGGAGPGGLPPALAAFAVAPRGDGWLLAAALPGRGLALARLRGPRVEARAARWAALVPLGRFLRQAGAAAA
ncbi:AP-5 complex subunit beta-1 isoform X2 [Dromaius novaehollandiae]|uniref:AP-5 complex subunit beta-1 isoform X2 n=1 Tax=Dromaius novaehollandiae TaxID=8790 RepID=UPI00311E9D63